MPLWELNLCFSFPRFAREGAHPPPAPTPWAAWRPITSTSPVFPPLNFWADCQTWISIFKRTQSGYKSADFPDFTYLIQKFASSPIFPIASCRFFMLLIHVKHGFLFSENFDTMASTLCQFWRTSFPRWLRLMCDPQKISGGPLLNRSC